VTEWVSELLSVVTVAARYRNATDSYHPVRQENTSTGSTNTRYFSVVVLFAFRFCYTSQFDEHKKWSLCCQVILLKWSLFRSCVSFVKVVITIIFCLCCICQLFVVFVCCAVSDTGHLAVDQTVNKQELLLLYFVFGFNG